MPSKTGHTNFPYPRAAWSPTPTPPAPARRGIARVDRVASSRSAGDTATRPRPGGLVRGGPARHRGDPVRTWAHGLWTACEGGGDESEPDPRERVRSPRRTRRLLSDPRPRLPRGGWVTCPAGEWSSTSTSAPRAKPASSPVGLG